MNSLVIVESPTKAKTIGKFLGKGFTIKSSYGHVRDLPKGEMGIDFSNDFEPQYVIPTAARKIVNQLKREAEKTASVYFATDEDREGEAISWHLQQIFKFPDDMVKRITFHEITKQAILEAIKHPHPINLNLVNAQQARRVLDRLVGYELSPLLWKKVARGLSAGRVQSVAVRLIVEREREIESFQVQEYWTVEGIAAKDGQQFRVILTHIKGRKLEKFELTKHEAEQTVADIDKKILTVLDVSRKRVTKTPPLPFTTAALQIEANRRFGFSAKQTMVLAQQLYEGIALGTKGQTGLITYMRTDSVNLADDFLRSAQVYIDGHLGTRYLTGGRRYKSKSRNIQEAHEAIRPTDVTIDPEQVRRFLNASQYKLYDLIWRRAVASQLPDSVSDVTTVTLTPQGTEYLLRASGSVLVFDGWQNVYSKKISEEMLPKLESGNTATLTSIAPIQHFTQPPARYSEAGLVRALEERGIGRPSTYAPTIATIIERKYAEKQKDKRLHPTTMGILVNDLLVKHFPDIVDYAFTAAMEENLDSIANGSKNWKPLVREFYEPFKKTVLTKEQELSKRELTEEASEEVCERCGKPMVIKLGRFGKFLACTGYPDCKNTKRLNHNGDVEQDQETGEVCEKCRKPMVIKHGRYGSFIACSGYPACKNVKNKTITTGVTCPKCGKGEIIQKRSKRGKTFFSCSTYPSCDFALWNQPTGERCPVCHSLLVLSTRGTVFCSKKGCSYKN